MVAGANGRNIISAAVAARLIIVDDDFTAAVVESSDAIDESTAECVDSANLSASGEEMSPNDSMPFDAEYSEDVEVVSPVVSDLLEIFWPLNNQLYPGTIQRINDNSDCIFYDDRD